MYLCVVLWKNYSWGEPNSCFMWNAYLSGTVLSSLLGIHAASGTIYSLFVLQYSWVYMYQLELVFRLLVRLQFMYFQYNAYLKHCGAHKHSLYTRTWSKTILGHPSWRALPASWGVKTKLILWTSCHSVNSSQIQWWISTDASMQRS